MKSEKQVENDIKAYIKSFKSMKQGTFVIKIMGTGNTMTDVPDLIGSFKGVPFAVEVKRHDGKPKPKQVFMLEVFRNGGYTVGVVKSLQEFKELFNED